MKPVRWAPWPLAPLLTPLLTPLVFAATPAAAQWEPTGTQRIVATLGDGARIELGRVRFSPAPDGQVAFELDWHTQLGGPFKDHFLSMREFKCIDGATELSCQVPYPHANPKTVSRQASAQQWVWLEHSLMFFFKRPADYGAKLWNGVYYELKATPQGLQGLPKAIDLNLIAAPPTSAGTAPYKPALRDEMPPQARWLRSLSIEP
jgi:hypothetical protein